MVEQRTRGKLRALLVSLAVVSAGCTGVADESKLPPDVKDPATLQTPAGALARYRGALDSLPSVLDWYAAGTAILTDELADLPTPPNVSGLYGAIDSRQLAPEGTDFERDYNRLHRLRAQAREARGFLAAYLSDTTLARPLQGHLYALEGYADILLADLFCSGIPLSTVDFNGDYTLQPGSPRDTVYRRAVGLFDSALTLLSDSVRLQPLASIGRGRALLALGRYEEAAAAVAGVETPYQYQVTFTYNSTSVTQDQRLLFPILLGTPDQVFTSRGGAPSVGDHDGGTGLDYLSAGDPRVVADLVGTDIFHHQLWLPRKAAATLPPSGSVTLTLADGIEARLIEAEAALQRGDVTAWLDQLNQLRTSGREVQQPEPIHDTLGVSQCGGTSGTCGGGLPDANMTTGGGTTPEYGLPAGGFQVPAGYALTDSFTINPVSSATMNDCYNKSWYKPCYVDVNTPSPGQTKVYVYTAPPSEHWLPGTGGVEGLALLEDPGSDAARVELLFRERAFWLYFTGHRQGDLRRLVRKYLRDPNTVYPSGSGYGQDVVAPVPQTEQQLNPKYTGCVNHGA